MLRGVAVATLAVAVTLLVIEVAARAFYTRMTTADQRRAVEQFLSGERGMSMAQLCAPHPYSLYMPVPGIWAHGLRQHNSLGFRGPELDPERAAFRIVCLGGSTTYGWSVADPQDSWPARLQAHLEERGHRVEVINAGLPMGTTAEALATLQFRVLPLQPRVVILHTGLNDVFPELMPGYRPDYSHDRVGWKFHESLLDHALFQSRALTLLRLRQPGTENELNWASYVAPEHWNWVENSIHGLAAARDPARYVGFENNVRTMAAICAEYGMRLVLSPTTLAPDTRTKLPALFEAYSANVGILRRLSETHEDVRWVDTLELPVPAEAFEDLCHLGPLGEDVKAGIFADFLLASGIVP